jgi:hypothetical protein
MKTRNSDNTQSNSPTSEPLVQSPSQDPEPLQTPFGQLSQAQLLMLGAFVQQLNTAAPTANNCPPVPKKPVVLQVQLCVNEENFSSWLIALKSLCNWLWAHLLDGTMLTGATWLARNKQSSKN